MGRNLVPRFGTPYSSPNAELVSRIDTLVIFLAAPFLLQFNISAIFCNYHGKVGTFD
jgi:hypothetical protein